MMNEHDNILLSQFADGELTSDRANELLLRVLDDPAAREKLKQMLGLRRDTVGWRCQRPAQPIVVMAQRPKRFRGRRLHWRAGSLAVAACVGGLLVLVGMWAAGWLGQTTRPRHQWQIVPDPDAPPLVARVTPEQMRQVAKVFALHESVAGPLAWYAADDRNIRLASARDEQVSHAPIAVLLKLDSARTGTGARTLVIVCREQQPAIIELPSGRPDIRGLRVYLAPRTVNGKVEMQYAIAVDGEGLGGSRASLSGWRRVGPTEIPLGQLALGDKTLNIEAAAWPMQEYQE